MDLARVEVTYKDITFDKYMKYINDWEGLFSKDPQYKKIKVIEKNAEGQPTLVYLRLGLGMLMTDRDLVCSATHKKATDGKHMIVLHTTDHPDYPETDDTIRIQSYYAATLEPTADGKGVKLFELQVSDAMGYIPPSLLNMVMGSSNKQRLEGLYDTMKGLIASES